MGQKVTIVELIAERDKMIIERDKAINMLQDNLRNLKDLVEQNQYGSLTNLNNKITSLIEQTAERLSSLYENQQK